MAADTQERHLNESSLPLWKSISRDLERRLAAGEFTTGFPGELALAENYQVSRGTVRNALRPLRESGAISAERGRRQHVIDAGRGLAFGPLHSLFASVRASGMTQRSIVLAQEVTTDTRAAQLLQVPAQEPLFHLERIRLADDEPLAHDEVWLPHRRVRALDGVNFGETALYKELRDLCGIVLDGGREELSADLAGGDDVSTLGCEPGDPVLRMERVSFYDGHPIELRRATILGRRCTVSVRFGSVPESDHE